MKTYKLIIKRGDYTYIDMFTSYSAMVTWLYTRFDYKSDFGYKSNVDNTKNVDNTSNTIYKFKDKLLTCGREYDVMFEVHSVYGKHSHKTNTINFQGI